MRLPERYRVTIAGIEPTKTHVIAAPDGLNGTRLALSIMAHYARKYKTDARIRGAALDIVSALPDKNYIGEITLIHRFVRDRVRYTRDVRDVETVASPLETLRIMQGDCDDKSTLLACLLESIGFECRFVAVGSQPGQFCHVLTQVNHRDKWLSLEATEQVSPGWFPPDQPYHLIQTIE